MKKHANEPDAYLWKAVDARTGETIPQVVFADEEAGVIERFTGRTIQGEAETVRERRTIRLVRVDG